MNIKNSLKKYFLISFCIFLLSGCSSKRIEVTNIQECVKPSKLEVEKLPIYEWDETSHICSSIEISKLAQTNALLMKKLKEQQNALDCYDEQFKRLNK